MESNVKVDARLLRVYGLVEIKRSINFNVPARPLRTLLVFHAALRADPIDKVHRRPNLFTGALLSR